MPLPASNNWQACLITWTDRRESGFGNEIIDGLIQF